MGGVYRKDGMLWCWYVDAEGKRQWESLKLRPGEEVDARKALAVIERRVEAEKQTGIPSGDLTVKAYGEKWIRMRQAQGVGSADDEGRWLRTYAWPHVGHLLLKELRPRHVRDMVRAVMQMKTHRGELLAPRSVRHVYATFRTMMREAMADELVTENVCALAPGVLPAKEDKDPTWREGAVFAREEVEALMSDERVPEERRTLYALLFLTGMRIGEVGALRWRRFDPIVQPLGKLHVAVSFNRKKKKEKSTKTKRPRDVPVHPTLAKVLAAWKLGGWERHMGRTPGLDDLLLPAPTENHLRDPVVYANLQHDLGVLGYRGRRTHDTRRTFISLALADGARKDVLRWVTHGPEGIMDLYTTLPWPSVCEEVGKLRLELREGRLLEFQPLAAVGCDGDCDGVFAEPIIASISSGLDLEKRVPRAGFEPSAITGESPGSVGTRADFLTGSPKTSVGLRLASSTPVTNVTDEVLDRLTAARAAWEADRDPAALREQLTAILGALP